MLKYVLLYLAVISVLGSSFILVNYFFGSRIFDLLYWGKVFPGKGRKKSSPFRGMLSEIVSLLLLQILILIVVVLFPKHLPEYIRFINNNSLFFVGAVVITILVVVHTMIVLPREDRAKLRAYPASAKANIRSDFVSKWFLTYFTYCLYSTCTWLLTLYVGGIYFAYNTVKSVSQINGAGRSIVSRLGEQALRADHADYTSVLSIVKNDFAQLGRDISHLTVNHAFFLGLICIVMILLTCSKLKHIWSKSGIEYIKWTFLLIMTVFGPAVLLIGTSFYEMHFDRIAPLIERILNNHIAGRTEQVFQIELLNEFVQDNFKPRSFFSDQIVTFKALAIWLLPLSSIVVSRFLQSVPINKHVDNLFPPQVANFLKRVLIKLSLTQSRGRASKKTGR